MRQKLTFKLDFIDSYIVLNHTLHECKKVEEVTQFYATQL